MPAQKKTTPPKKKSATPHVDRALAYAKAVRAGQVPAGELVRLACTRHTDDLLRARTKAFRYTFDAERAERVCRFAELFPHVKGHWAIAKPGKKEAPRIQLEDWQCFFLCVLFGWVQKAKPHFRRFRTAYLEVPRKNGKSVLAALVGLYFFAADGEYGAEVYSGATSEKQAWEVFRPARAMAEKTPDFLDAYGVVVNAQSLVIPGNGSRFEPVIGKPGDGASPSLAIADEYHEHQDPAQYDTMVTGMGARQQPLMLVITTAGENLESPCYALHERVAQVLKGVDTDEELFGLVYGLDPEDDWTTETALRKANPNFGVSVAADYLLRQQANAVAQSREQNITKTKHFNVWVTSRTAWLNMEWWHRQKEPALRLEDFLGQPCVAASDLASKIDLAATALLFRRRVQGDDHYYLFVRSYVPEATVQDPRHRHYQGWAREGHLVVTEGDEIDQERIKADLLADAQRFDLRELAFDEWGATKLVQELQAAGLTAVRIPQTAKHLSDPMKTLEAKVKAGRLWHDGNPVLAWMMSNVTVKPDANENIFPRKDRPENKIDGAVASVMAIARMEVLPEPKRSVYESRGVRAIG